MSYQGPSIIGNNNIVAGVQPYLLTSGYLQVFGANSAAKAFVNYQNGTYAFLVDTQDGLIEFGGNILPITTNLYNLGSPTHVFSNIYANSINITGLGPSLVVQTDASSNLITSDTLTNITLAGTTTLSTLNPSQLLQNDGGRNMITSNTLPSGCSATNMTLTTPTLLNTITYQNSTGGLTFNYVTGSPLNLWSQALNNSGAFVNQFQQFIVVPTVDSTNVFFVENSSGTHLFQVDSSPAKVSSFVDTSISGTNSTTKFTISNSTPTTIFTVDTVNNKVLTQYNQLDNGDGDMKVSGLASPVKFSVTAAGGFQIFSINSSTFATSSFKNTLDDGSGNISIAGTITTVLNASQLVQTNASKVLISSNTLPTGCSAGGMTLISPTFSGVITSGLTGPAMVQTNSSGVLVASNTIFNTLTMSSLTASTALVLDGSKNITSSATTSTQIGYLSGVTSDVQTQINSKVAGSGLTTGDYIVATGSGSVGNAAYLSESTGTTTVTCSAPNFYANLVLTQSFNNIAGTYSIPLLIKNTYTGTPGTSGAIALRYFVNSNTYDIVCDENGNIYPATTGTYSWGTSTKVWKNVYSNALTITGTSTVQTILPSTGNTYNIGSTGSRFNAEYLYGFLDVNNTAGNGNWGYINLTGRYDGHAINMLIMTNNTTTNGSTSGITFTGYDGGAVRSSTIFGGSSLTLTPSTGSILMNGPTTLNSQINFNASNASQTTATGYTGVSMPTITRWYYTATIVNPAANTSILTVNLPSGVDYTKVVKLDAYMNSGTIGTQTLKLLPAGFTQNLTLAFSPIIANTQIVLYTSSTWALTTNTVTVFIWLDHI